MPESILDSTKKVLGIEPEATAFDIDIIMHINTAFFTLQQIGIGPASGFMITDNKTNWEDFLGPKTNFNAVKTYMYLRVRILFDPPATSFALDAINKQITELEWRLNVEAENYSAIKEDVSPLIVWAIEDQEGFPAGAHYGEIGIDPETGNVWRAT